MSEVINAFPGYEYIRLEDGKYHNMYRGTDVGRGGYVYAEPGIYSNVALLDVRNMHGESIVRLNKLGDATKTYAEIREARNAIKAHDFDTARKLLDGKLAKFLNDENEADKLANGLKLILNSTYGIAAASFDNPLRDPRDVNNIIALRGALFMRTLQDEIIDRGFRGVHYKTDSVKVPNATPEIIEFIMDFGKKYGYEFEHEATYERMCLVNDAVYIARYDERGVRNKGGKHANEWTATGAQFQQPYVFKTLFSGEPLEFADLCETKSVTSGAIYLDMNEECPDVTEEESELEKLCKKSGIDINDILKCEHDQRCILELKPEQIPYMNEAIRIRKIVATGHSYQFVGRVGLFFPVKEGRGGGVMLREKNGKYYAVTGTKGYRWLEAETIKTLHRENDLDSRYHNDLANEAIKAIDKFGSFERFIDISKPYDYSATLINDLPFDLVPCGDPKRSSCIECPNLVNDICKRGYSLNSYLEKGGDV